MLPYPVTRDKRVRPVPTGRVKWYDAEKGFGFLSQEEGEDVYVRSSALPAGVEDLKAGQKVEFGVAAGPSRAAGAEREADRPAAEPDRAPGERRRPPSTSTRPTNCTAWSRT